MADQKITELTALTGANLAVADLFVLVDVSDTTMSATGTDKKITAVDTHGVILQSPAYAASFTPDPTVGDFIKVGALTGNITVNLPASAYAGQRFVLELVQDGTGSRTISFNASYLGVTAGSTTASKKSLWTFLYDGASWIQQHATIGI